MTVSQQIVLELSAIDLDSIVPPDCDMAEDMTVVGKASDEIKRLYQFVINQHDEMSSLELERDRICGNKAVRREFDQIEQKMQLLERKIQWLNAWLAHAIYHQFPDLVDKDIICIDQSWHIGWGKLDPDEISVDELAHVTGSDITLH